MKRYMSFILTIFMIFMITLSANAKNSSLSGKVIIIDPGHGNKDPGTTFGDLYEKNINLEISLALKKELSSSGAIVIMTRDRDYDLAYPSATYRKKSDFDNRIKLINNSGADLYISIHLNFLNNSAYYGPQVFYDKENKSLALILQHQLNKDTKTSREVKTIPSSTYMYDKLNIPGVLIECGFLSNANERGLLVSDAYQEKIAMAIKKGLSEYFVKNDK